MWYFALDWFVHFLSANKRCPLPNLLLNIVGEMTKPGRTPIFISKGCISSLYTQICQICADVCLYEANDLLWNSDSITLQSAAQSIESKAVKSIKIMWRWILERCSSTLLNMNIWSKSQSESSLVRMYILLPHIAISLFNEREAKIFPEMSMGWIPR